MELFDVAKNFKLKNFDIKSIEKYGEGHINLTYLVLLNDGTSYILQKINNHIFPNVEGLMNNISLVLEHLRNNSSNLKDPSREIMNIIKTNDDKLFYFDKENDSYYRVYDFVKDSITLQKIEDKELFKESAIGFGKFASDLQTFDASKLVEIIPNFHNTKSRFEHFKKTLESNPKNRKDSCLNEIEFVLSREKYCDKIVNKIEQNLIPLRVTHNDTKLNNILLDNKTLKSLCVIDLDTIMPGSLLYDFGDSIRFGCNPAGEDVKDLSKVKFNIKYFKSYVEGYLSQVHNIITKEELDNLAFGALLMTFECGTRFLDDYLDGDNYFRTKYETHNLERARTQFKLVSDIEKLLPKMNKIVIKTYKKIN